MNFCQFDMLIEALYGALKKSSEARLLTYLSICFVRYFFGDSILGFKVTFPLRKGPLVRTTLEHEKKEHTDSASFSTHMLVTDHKAVSSIKTKSYPSNLYPKTVFGKC